MWHCPYPVYSACLCKFASILLTAVAVWHCPYPVYSACLCGFASILFTAVGVCGISPILFTELACAALLPSCLQRLVCVALPLSCLQSLLVRLCFHLVYSGWCVWHFPYPVYRACLCGFASILFTAVGVCGISPILFTELACAALLPSYLQRLVCAFIVSLSLGGLGCYPGSPLPAHLKYSNSFWTVGSPFLKYYSHLGGCFLFFKNCSPFRAACSCSTLVPFERFARCFSNTLVT